MKHYRYLILGGGMAADAAVRGIREVDANGSIGIVGAEENAPYARPPLSKALWKGDPVEGVWLGTAEHGAELHLGRRATEISLSDRRVRDDRGDLYAFDRLLLATGGTPRTLPFGDEGVIYFRTLDDYRRLRTLADAGQSFAVIGGGFIGSEIAAALATQGSRVTMLFPEGGIGARVFPADLARFLVGYYGERGVEVSPGESVVGLDRKGARVAIETSNGRRLDVDAVVAGIGIVPNVGLAKAAGLAVADGVLVDEHLRTSHPDVFAAGDVALLRPRAGAGVRVEHEDFALRSGKAAGRGMAGEPTPYGETSFFYSDLFDLGYEAVGETNPGLETVADWKEPFREGVVYYLADGRVRGVLLWNTWGQVEAARALIAEGKRVRPAGLVGRLPTD